MSLPSSPSALRSLAARAGTSSPARSADRGRPRGRGSGAAYGRSPTRGGERDGRPDRSSRLPPRHNPKPTHRPARRTPTKVKAPLHRTPRSEQERCRSHRIRTVVLVGTGRRSISLADQDSQVALMGTRAHSLADRAAWSAEQSIAPLFARAKLFGLPNGATRALEYGCGSGVTTGAVAGVFDEVGGVDPAAGGGETGADLDHGGARCGVGAGGSQA